MRVVGASCKELADRSNTGREPSSGDRGGNRSTDATRSVVERLANESGGRVLYVAESRNQGRSFALNATRAGFKRSLRLLLIPR
jgi:hypothetical protein